MRAYSSVAFVRIAALMVACPVVLGACGQRGALYLPDDEHARDNRAVYMLYHAPADQQQDKSKAKPASKKVTAVDSGSAASATDTATSSASK